MTRFLKATAIAALAITTALPAFAAAHLDVNSMTCEAYNDLSGADRDKVALMVVADMANNSDATVADNNGTATATAPCRGYSRRGKPSRYNRYRSGQ